MGVKDYKKNGLESLGDLKGELPLLQPVKIYRLWTSRVDLQTLDE